MQDECKTCLFQKMMKNSVICLQKLSTDLFCKVNLHRKLLKRIFTTETMAEHCQQLEKIVRLDPSSENEWALQIKAACKSLRSDHIIAVPTDTIYGIAGLAQSSRAVEKMYNIKNRNTSKPVAICVGDVADVDKWGEVTVSPDLLSRLLPGPVTVVLERTAALNPSLNPGTSLVGIRVPDYGFVRSLARECGEPLALTSANVSNGASTVSVQEFIELWPALDLIFDGGVLGSCPQSRLGSTVVDLSKRGSYTVIRDGSAYSETVQKLQSFGLIEEKKS